MAAMVWQLWYGWNAMAGIKEYGCPVKKSPSLHDQKSTTNPKFLGKAEVYFACHIVPNFQLSLTFAFIGVRSTRKV